MITPLNTVCISTTFLILWFHTEAFVEYTKLFRLHRLFKVSEFEEDFKNDFTLEYLPWLRNKYPCFFTKLVSCPWCIGLWVSAILSLFNNTFDYICIQYLVSMTMYFVIVNKLL